MESLDRQGWTVGLSFTAYGLRIGIRANSELALSAVLERLPPGLKRSDVPEVDMLYSVIAGDRAPMNGLRRYSLAYANSTQLARSTEFESLPLEVERHLSLHLAEFAKSRVFIHAGVVGWKRKAVLVPGRTHAGKSTLVTALLRAGATYYSDEFALVDRLGRIHPHPSPIQLRNGDGTTHRIQPADLPARVGMQPLRLGLVLVTQHRVGASWRPRRITPGEGMLAVLVNTVSAQRDPGRAMGTIAKMLTGARLLKGPRGEADATVACLLRAGHLPGQQQP
jgi:hypothetical protein